MDATRFREWDSERGDAIQIGLGERLVCSSWMPRREAVGEVGKHRETLLGMEESAKVRQRLDPKQENKTLKVIPDTPTPQCLRQEIASVTILTLNPRIR
jgi:hypothetical protein